MFDGEWPRAGGAGPLRRYWLMTTEAPGFGGGIGVHTGETAHMLAARGVEVTVLHHDASADAPVCGWADGYRTIRFGSRGLDHRPIPHANLQGPLRAAREAGAMAADLIAAEGLPDMVEAQDYGALAQHLLKLRLMEPGRAWPRVVITAHRPHLHCVIADGDSPHEHRTAFLGQAERWCYAAADAVISPCRFILGPLAALGFPVERAQVVANPYDADRLLALEPCAHLEREAAELAARVHTTDEPLLFFGKLQVQKGAPDLLAALDALHTHGEAPPCWLFGRDAWRSGVAATAYDDARRRHARLFEAGRVRYFGGYGAATLRALCGVHPIAALPYREDCLPYAFVEAVLCGALPLTSANGGQAELMPEDLRERLTADVAYPDAWVAKLAALRALPPGERAAMSRRLTAAVRARTAPAAVFAAKSAILERVVSRHGEGDYPFAYGPSLGWGAPDREGRVRLAEAVPQRGRTRSLREAGPPPALAPAALVSVVIPYHEMQDYLGETLASVEAQDHAEVEIVIVDDGSPSPAAARRLEAVLAEPRRFPTRVLRKTNGGLADARNAGAKLARGDYLYFLDADDRIHPATLSRSLKVLRRFANVGYVGAGLKEFGDSDGEWAVHDVDGPYLGFHNLQICAFLVRTEAWLEHGVNDPAMLFGMEDYESHLRMAAAGVRGVALPEPLFGYRKRPGSMSRAFDPQAVAYLYRRAWASSPQFLRRHAPELVGLYAENGHGALAPSACEASPTHAALLGRPCPDLAEVAEALEARASRERLARALQGRCAQGGAEWDYTAARLLMALDLEPAFARQLLRAATAAAPGNGWFRFYALVAELRDGREAAAAALWDEALAGFCRAEAGAVGWIAALEAARGYPCVRETLAARLAPLGLAPPASAQGPFAAVHAALAAVAEGAVDEAEALAAIAGCSLSREAAQAILARTRRISVSTPPAEHRTRPPGLARPLRSRLAALVR